MRGQDPEPVLRGLCHLGIGVRGQAPQFPFQSGGADVSRDDEHRGQVRPAMNGFLDEGLGSLPGLYEKHARDGADACIRRSQCINQRSPGRA